MRKRSIFTLGMAGLAFTIPSAPSSATLTTSFSPDSEIVVTGKKITKDAIAEFVKTTMGRPKGGSNDGQYARFQGIICPKVVGLSERNTQQIEERMRGVALAADMRVAADGCAPNVLVMVVSNGQEAISDLRKKRPRVFGDMANYEKDRIARSGGPAFSWKRIQTSSAESGALHNSDHTTILPTDEMAKTEAPTMNSNVKSLIKSTVQQSVTHSFLLLEEDALVGLTTVQIADYAAMRSYIDANDSKSADAPAYSILSLFDYAKADKGAPGSVSEMDLALLSSLYSSPADVSAAMQSSAMAQRIEKEFTADKQE